MKKIFLFIFFILFVVAFTKPISAAIPNWNITGVWEAQHEYGGTLYTHVNHVTQYIAITPEAGLDGYGGWNGYVNGSPTGGSNLWDITNETSDGPSYVSGDIVHFIYRYNSGENCKGYVDATISSDGSMTGTWHDNCNGIRTGNWTTDFKATPIVYPSAPTINTPANNSIVINTALTKVDWTDSLGTFTPITYQYESYRNTAYTTLAYSSGWLANSEIPTPGTPAGDYYLRVRAKDVYGHTSEWSNDSANPYKITVVLDSDKDGIYNGIDNCISVANPDQVNTDNDEYGDACDEDDDNDTVLDIDDCAPTNPEISVLRDTKACILYTSGITGKGILTAPGLQKSFNENSSASENAGKKKN